MPISSAWEALRGDPLPWLLDERHPNLHWRALTELVGRPAASPAVERARGGANAVEPVAALLEALLPDGSWADGAGWWDAAGGHGWRLLGAVQWGADPADPRLQAAASRLLAEAPGEGGFAAREGGSPAPWLTARVLQALAGLGFGRHARFQEALAWLEEAAPKAQDGGWAREGAGDGAGPCRITPVALLAALAACGDDRRHLLRDRATRGVVEVLAYGDAALDALGHPCLARTDLAEALWVLARSGAEVQPVMVPALARLQERQLDGGRWPRDLEVPAELALGKWLPAVGEPSRWLTLKSAVAILHYAVPAGLPRMFPKKPD